MKYFALALFAAAVNALDSEHYHHQHHQPSHSYYQKPQQTYHAPKPQQNFTYATKPQQTYTHAPKSGSYAPVYTQTKGYQSTPQQFGYGHAAPNYSHGGFYHQPNHAHNPFEYSRPAIPYVAAKLTGPVYATCNVPSALSSNAYFLKFGQLPGHPIQVEGTFDYMSASPDDVISMEVHKYGDITESVANAGCDQVGDEFNPLQDKHVSTRETRGTITDHVVVSTDSDEWTMAAWMQNLGGKDSIIGRSIVFSNEGSEDSCCVIGLDAPPEVAAPTYTAHYHPAQHYGYGGYGHHGYGHHGHHGHH